MAVLGACPICATPMVTAGSKRSAFSHIDFHLARCPGCRAARVVDPRTDYADIYNEAYYRGAGADPKVDYLRELDDPRTLRVLEWRAIVELAAGLVPLTPETRWLDFGCGVGGLLRHLRQQGYQHAVGYDQGFSADFASQHGLPIVSDADLDGLAGTFDVITSIEVLEHVVDPMPYLDRVATLLAPGGIFIVTTGNVERAKRDLARWIYVIPDVHVTFLGPTSLRHAYGHVGLRPETPGFQRCHVGLIRYKLLKTLGCKQEAGWQRLVPWRLTTRLLDVRYGFSAMPFGRKPFEPRPG
jgi:2-polyprenyl-3-methyl-5-hydroxy-6-metoxy-1,4-benzoquinol methylase